MKLAWPTTTKILTGFFVTAMCAMPQGYTISAKPGVVNYIEGNAALNGREISAKNLKTTFLNANDTLSTDIGKAEVLLAPGVFLRLGDNTAVRMVSPSLTDTQIELKSGEAMIEADDIVKDSRVTVINGGGTASIERNGLYRFTANDPRSVAVLEGKVQVNFGDRKSDIGKGHELVLNEQLKSNKFDTKRPDDLYAWSNVRAEYDAASSYQTAKDVDVSSYGGAWGGYGFSGFSNPGWAWNGGLNSWAWLPGNSAYFSPFGYGFYGPGLVAYAPVVYAPGYGYGGYGYPVAGGGGGRVVGSKNPPTKVNLPAPGGKTIAVPVNPGHPPAVGQFSNSLAANQAARISAARSFADSGYRTAGGGVVSAGHATSMFSGASRGASAGSGGHANYSGGGYSGGGGRAGGFNGASVGSSAGAHSAGPAAARRRSSLSDELPAQNRTRRLFVQQFRA